MHFQKLFLILPFSWQSLIYYLPCLSPPQIPIHNVRVRSIRPCSFPLKWRYGLTKFPIGTPRPQTNVSASLHCFVLDSASWDIAPVSRLNMCVLWKSWIAINRNERRNVNARSRNRYFQVKKCSSHLKPRWINAHKSFWIPPYAARTKRFHQVYFE